MKKRRPKIRESERLILNIALCTMGPHETLKQAMHNVRVRLPLSKAQNHKSEVETLREMWAQLREGKPWATMNKMIANGYMRPLTPDEFDDRKRVLAIMQKKARNLEETKALARKEGIL